MQSCNHAYSLSHSPVLAINVTSNRIIKSPNYPLDYDNGARLAWDIQKEGLYQVLITFTNFYTENIFDFVDVYDYIDNEYRLMKTFTGIVSQTSLRSTGNKMKVKFTSDVIGNRPGFRFSVQFGM